MRFKIKTNAVSKLTYSGSGMRRVAGSEAELISFDLGIGGVIDPFAERSQGLPYQPVIEVGNFGEELYLAGANVHVRILDDLDGLVYAETMPVPELGEMQSLHLVFPGWQGGLEGGYRMLVELQDDVNSDENLINNQLLYPFQLVPGDPPEWWLAEFIGLPLPMDFDAIEREVVAPGVGLGVGLGVEGLSDEVGFVHQSVDGDFFVAGLVSGPELALGASLGLMARVDNQPGAPMVSWTLNGALNLNFSARETLGSEAGLLLLDPAPLQNLWLGLERQGDLFRAHVSVDGLEWELLAQQSLPGWPERLLVGIASASGQGPEQPPSIVAMYAVSGFPVGLEEVELLEDLMAVPLSQTEIQLQWPDLVATELGYAIYRSADGDVFSEIAITPPDTMSFLDDGLSPATSYFYEVRPLSDEGEGHPPVFALGETMGEGLESWAASNRIADPEMSPPAGGEAWVFHYFTGASPSQTLSAGDLMVQELRDGIPTLRVTKAAGVFDLAMGIEALDVSSGLWQEHFVIEAGDPSGDYEFTLPGGDEGRSIHRLRLSPPE